MASSNKFQSYKFQLHKKGQPLHSSAKIIVMNVFEKLKEHEKLKTYTEVIKLTSLLTGVSTSSIGRMQVEFRETGTFSTLGQNRPSRVGKSTKHVKKRRQTPEDCCDSPSASQVDKESDENREAEKVLGQRKTDGKNFVLVKWKGIQAPEYLEKNNLTEDILNLYKIYIQEELGELNNRDLSNDGDQTQRIEVIKKEIPTNITDYGWNQLQIAEEMQEYNPKTDCLDVKLE